MTIGRVWFERGVLDRHDFMDGGSRQVRPKRTEIRTRNQDRNRRSCRLIALGGQLLRASDGFPRRAVEFSATLLTDDQNHWITRASSRRRRTSSLAASVADPLIMCVFLPFSGGYKARMRLFVAAVAA